MALLDDAKTLRALTREQWRERVEGLLRDHVEDAIAEGRVTTINFGLKGLRLLEDEPEDYCPDAEGEALLARLTPEQRDEYDCWATEGELISRGYIRRTSATASGSPVTRRAVPPLTRPHSSFGDLCTTAKFLIQCRKRCWSGAMARRDLRQLGLADGIVRRRGKRTTWLDRLDAALDRPVPETIAGPVYASREGGRAYPLLTCVKLSLLRQWYGLPDEGLEGAGGGLGPVRA